MVWLTRNMLAPPPMAPAPEIVLSTLVSVLVAVVPTIKLSALFDIVSLPPPLSVTFWLEMRICALPLPLVWFSLISPVLLIVPASDSIVWSLTTNVPVLFSTP